jgi:succinate-semialdehyde dehydrogenase/glutarate-semialdehyde dehydrogenase
METTLEIVKDILPPSRRMYIGGRWVPSSSGATYDVISPVDSSRLSAVPEASAEDVQMAIEEARASSETWARTPSVKRAGYLMKMVDLLIESKETLPKIISAENGKVLESSEGELTRGVGILTACAEEGKRMYGTVYPSDSSINVASESSLDRLIFSRREPYGVVVAIPPYNDPLSSTMYKAGPALAAGNTVILKAPPQTPLTPLFIALLSEKAGLPRGVLNVVTSNSSAPGEQLVKSPGTDAVTFTGSTRSGIKIYEAASATNKKLVLEMSGSDPMIILEDAEIDRAVGDAVKARFHNAGQICSAAKRILVNEKIAPAFREKFMAQVRTMVVGNPFREGVTMGPVIDGDTVANLSDAVDTSVRAGARLLAGGHALTTGEYSKGHYYPPTVLDGVTADMDVFSREMFGPVAPIVEFSDDDEALELANSSIYGLQSAIYTVDIRRALRMASGLKCGGVMINEPPFMRWENIPFGGEKMSGLGRDAAQISIEELTRTKVIDIGLTR